MLERSTETTSGKLQTARERNCVLGRGCKRVDAETNLGAAGKSACATKTSRPELATSGVGKSADVDGKLKFAAAR